MRKKKILIIVFILLCALTGISVGHYFWKESKKMTGVEWFAEQESYVKQMETYTDSMDDIMTLYLNGTITKDDFLNHLSVKQDELMIMKGMYQKEKKAHPVRTGTHNYATKKGCEAVEKCYLAFDDLILMAEKNADDKKALAYKYIAAHETLIDHLSDYMASYETVSEQLEEIKDE